MGFSGGSGKGYFSGMMALEPDQSGLWSVWERKKCNSEYKQLLNLTVKKLDSGADGEQMFKSKEGSVGERL